MAQVIGSYGPTGSTPTPGTSATVDITSPQIQEAVRSYIEATRDTGFTITPNETAGYFNLRFHPNIGGATACKGEDIIGKLTTLTKFYTDHPEQRLAERKTTTINAPKGEAPAQRAPAAADRPVITLTNADLPANRRTSEQRMQTSTVQRAKSAPAELSDAEIDAILPDLIAKIGSEWEPPRDINNWKISRDGLTFKAERMDSNGQPLQQYGQNIVVTETAKSRSSDEITRAVTDSVYSLKNGMGHAEIDIANSRNQEIAEQNRVQEEARLSSTESRISLENSGVLQGSLRGRTHLLLTDTQADISKLPVIISTPADGAPILKLNNADSKMTFSMTVDLESGIVTQMSTLEEGSTIRLSNNTIDILINRAKEYKLLNVDYARTLPAKE